MNTPTFHICIVEDNEWYNKLLVHQLTLNPDYVVRNFFSGKELLKNLNPAPDVITLDYRLPDIDGRTLLAKIKEIAPESEVIIISEQDAIETAVELLKNGAYDYIVKGNDIRDRLLNTIQNIEKNAALRQRITRLETEVQRKYEFSRSIIGNSQAMLRIHDLVAKALSTNINVMITGETGTGKEVIAKAIHYNSTRKNKPFIAVNVAALPSELIESELFGHEKGAFTNAIARRIGKFEEANGGTLFLDEIGEMDMAFQSKLLRALQEREIIRIGSNAPVKTDCRVITATNRNLREQVKAGRFREDLYYRLIGLPIELPPLREREKDVLILARHFITSFSNENNIPEKQLSPQAQDKLLGYAFPGNVRELKSVIELATVLSAGEQITADDIALHTADTLSEVVSEELTMRQYELRILKIYMNKYNNDVKRVAEKLDISPATIYRMLKE